MVMQKSFKDDPSEEKRAYAAGLRMGAQPGMKVGIVLLLVALVLL